MGCEDEDMVNKALKELNYSTDIMIKYLSKKYDGNLTVITKLMRDSTLDRMKRSQAILKEQLFVDVLLQNHHKSMNALEYSLKNETNGSYFEYFLSFDAVKQFYNAKDCEDIKQNKSIYRLLYWTFVDCNNDDIASKIIRLIDFDKDTIIKRYLNYEYEDSEEKEHIPDYGQSNQKKTKHVIQRSLTLDQLDDDFSDIARNVSSYGSKQKNDEDAFKSQSYNIMGQCIYKQTLKRLKLLDTIIGEDALVENATFC